jgi:hypothetical protein
LSSSASSLRYPPPTSFSRRPLIKSQPLRPHLFLFG